MNEMRTMTNRGEPRTANGSYWKADSDRGIYIKPHSICGERIVEIRFLYMGKLCVNVILE